MPLSALHRARTSTVCRADSIVGDAELVRAAIVPKDLGSGQPGKWSVLGQ